MLVNSTDCCRYFCDLYGIPKTRTYIIGHNEVPGVSTDCPGPLPWDTYMALVNNTAPIVTQHPSAQYVCQGSTATFTVVAIGAGPLTYQWQRNGIDLSNEGHYSDVTTATLTVSGTDSGDIANYRCQVSNTYGDTTSNSAALSFKAATVIAQHPQSQQVAVGGTVTFSVTAGGEGPLSYQWRKNGSVLGNGGRISGATSATLQIDDVVTTDFGNYTCVVTADCGNATSQAAMLVVGIPGDLDGDGDVDLADFGVFQSCLTGTGNAQNDPDCVGAKLEGGDEDVDWQDLANFRGCISGAGIPGDQNCLGD